MGNADRFDHLEPPRSPALPEDVRSALDRLKRFDPLEIGELRFETTQEVDRVLCAHCGQYNERVRTHCWACYRWVGSNAPAPAAPPPALELILDGKTYRPGDANVPEDVQRLMEWIQRDGFSPELLAKWRQWRATRNQAIYREKTESAGGPPVQGEKEVKLFRGQRVSVITIDGQTHTSLDKDLPPDVKALFDYLATNEVTPDLLDHLRTYGTKVKYRPHTTADPTDGDLSFWDRVGALFGAK